MDSCENIQRIGAYHDGEMSAAEAEALEAHLSHCLACRKELDRLRAMSRWLSSAGGAEVSDAALARLRRSLQPGRDRAGLRMAKALTAAAAAVLIVCSALLWQRSQAAPASAGPPAPWERRAVMPAKGL